MSIVVAVRVGEGLVLAADSASTLQARDPGGRLAGIAKIFNNATKLLQLRDYPVGVATWGAGNIGARSISSLISEYANTRPKLEDIEQDSLSVQEEKQLLLDFLFEFYTGTYPDWEAQPEDQRVGFGVLIGGYSGREFFPQEFVFDVPARQVRELRIPLPDGPQNFGADWFGSADALVRFHHGRDDRLPEILARHGVETPKIEAIMETLRREIQYPVPFDGMPIQDAVDYALFMTGLEVARYRFALGAELCGGPIDVATITRHRGFEWIRQKTIKA